MSPLDYLGSITPGSLHPGSVRPRPVRPRREAIARAVLAGVVGLVGGWLGLALGGTVHHEVGPLTTSMRVHPVWGGGSSVVIPPLGELDLDTHAGPLGIEATLEGVDVEEARQIVRDPEVLASLKPQAERDLRWELEMALLRGLLTGVLGAAAVSALTLRRAPATLVGAGTATAALLTSFAVGLATWNPAALAEPRYTGLLTSAPSVVGSAESIVSDFSVYGDQLARIVQNVSGLYTVTSNLPLLPAQHDVVKVLHVSDLHLAPQAWDLVRTVATQYDVDVVVDSGDITDHGTRAENRYLQEIRRLDVPYLWVRGNHDSKVTEAAMRRIPRVVVLDGQVRTVAGLSFLGAGDPSFTPDKSADGQSGAVDAELVEAAADRLVATAREHGGVDVAVFHDPAAADAFDGVAHTALFGHLHYRKVSRGALGSWLMVEGSTGGSGLRALEPAEPANIEMSVLYVDRATGALRAYDDIRLGGLGLASAEINRHVVDVPDDTTEMVAPDPDSAADSGS